MAEAALLTCGWCRCIIPALDEVQHHFFVAHGQAVDQSVRYHYPASVGDDVERWFRSPAAASCGSPDTKEER